MTHKEDGDLTGVARLYEESLEKHGAAPMGVGWRDETSHLLRFEKLVSLIDRDVPVSVNDLGCGYGALYGHLIDAGVTVQRYHGYDISDQMLQQARKSLPDSGGIDLIRSATLEHVADYSVASGIFNVRLESTEDEWRAHVIATLADMNAHSTRGFSFNLLSTYVDYREDHLYYGDPLFYFDYCKKEFSRFVTLHHDYPLYEWTIAVRK